MLLLLQLLLYILTPSYAMGLTFIPKYIFQRLFQMTIMAELISTLAMTREYQDCCSDILSIAIEVAGY